MQLIEETLALASVKIPRGVTIATAIERHRDRTGYGGGCILYFEPPPRKVHRTGRGVRAKRAARTV